MRKEDLFEAIEDIDPDSVNKARLFRKRRRPLWAAAAAVAACAALIIGTIGGVITMRQKAAGSSVTTMSGITTVRAAYPEPVAQTLSAQAFMESDEHWQWWQAYHDQASGTEGLQSGMTAYNLSLMAQLLVSDRENTVCSPLNTYIAFAMLAEVSGGRTRQQVLTMLGADDIGTLRSQVTALWESNYADTPVLKSLLANSVWLSSDVTYHEDTLKNLADHYYASAFSGTPGSEAMNEALRKWTDDNTGGLLSDYTKTMALDPDTVLEILSTIYYKAMWREDFREENTTQEVFHGTAGDTTAAMMHKTDMMSVYRSDKFLSTSLGLSDSGAMHFFLPNEGVDVNELVSDPAVMSALRYDSADSRWSFPEVNLTVPKFKVSGKTDLLEAVRALGVTDALDPSLSDFTPLTADRENLYLSKAEHAAMIEIDEYGVTGAAYTELALAEGAAEPDEVIDLVLDRPFLFVVTGLDGSVLFAGVVRNIDA